MVQVTHLKKSYKLNRKQMAAMKVDQKIKIAVSDVSFEAFPGEIFGLLGPNGAGKTTTLRCISTLLKPTLGTISVMGYDVEKNPEAVRNSIAFLTNDLKLDKHFTPDYTADFFAQLHGVAAEDINARKEALFDYFGITPFKNKRIGELSTGMMQKVSIVVSLLHDPEVIIFDEPTNGLDIITARKVTDYLKTLKARGKVVIISTHIMDFAEKLCDRVAIVLDGEIKLQGSLPEILSQTGQRDLEDAFFHIYERTEQASEQASKQASEREGI